MKKYTHPDEKSIHEECTITINRADDGGCWMFVWDGDIMVLKEWEPDFEWAWETATYFSKKHNLEIVDNIPY